MKEVTGWKTVGNLQYNGSKCLGKGSFGVVFDGTNGTKKVAVKRIQIVHLDDSWKSRMKSEVELMQMADDHPNILQYICAEQDDTFVYIATECCAGTLTDYVNGKYKGPEIGDEKNILRQITEGLAYLHRIKIVHRDITPNNILIWIPFGDNTDDLMKPKMKLADFGLSKFKKMEDEQFITTSNPSGVEGWMAPELIQPMKDEYKTRSYNYSVDIFPLGCIFGYILSTNRKHPFGNNSIEQSTRIYNGDPIVLASSDLKTPYNADEIAIQLIQSMTEMNPDKRIEADDILNHDFFAVSKTSPPLIKATDMTVVLLMAVLLIICGIKETIFLPSPAMNLDRNSASNKLSTIQAFSTSNKWPDEESGIRPPSIVTESEIRAAIENSAFNKTEEIIQLYLRKRKLSAYELLRFTQLVSDRSFDVNHIIVAGGNHPLENLFKNYTHKNLIFLARRLIENGIDVHDTYTTGGWNLLHIACQYYKHDNLIDLVKLLLENGVDASATTPLEYNSLHILCQDYAHDNLIGLVELLVEYGIDVTAKTSDGWNSLHMLCNHYRHKNLIDLIMFLTTNGIDVSVKTNHGWNSLHYLSLYYLHRNFLSVVLFLEKQGIDLNEKTDEGETASTILKNRNPDREKMSKVIQCLDGKGRISGMMLLTLYLASIIIVFTLLFLKYL